MKEKDVVRVTAGVIWCNDRLLLARRAPGKHLPGYWEFPGGKIEPGESMQACLEREILEEFELSITSGEYIGAETFRYSDRTIELHAFHALAHSQCGPGDSHDQVAWIAVEDLNRYNIAPADAFIVDYLNDASVPRAPGRKL